MKKKQQNKSGLGGAASVKAGWVWTQEQRRTPGEGTRSRTQESFIQEGTVGHTPNSTESQATKLTRSRKKPKDEEQTAQTESRETMRVGAKTERSKELGRLIYTGEQDTGETQRGIVNRNTGEDKAFKIKQEVNKKKSHTADSDTFFVCRDVLSHYI